MGAPIVVGILAAIRAGVPAAKLIAKYGKKAYNAAKKRYEDIHQNVLEYFGKYAGYSQQFLYKMERDLNEKKWL